MISVEFLSAEPPKANADKKFKENALSFGAVKAEVTEVNEHWRYRAEFCAEKAADDFKQAIGLKSHSLR